MRYSADTIARVTAGAVVMGRDHVVATSVSIDSRHVRREALFACFPGERTDGHDFVPAAVERGASIIMITRDPHEVPGLAEATEHGRVAVVRVRDMLGALADLATFHRSTLSCPVVGITGSTGKTTTKDFMAGILSLGMRSVATEGNRNNEIGVPLTILAAEADTQVVVVEMGMRGLGQIRESCRIARPTIGVLTNIGTCHIEVVGDQQAIVDAKSELLECLNQDGSAILNADDAYFESVSARTEATVVTYGIESEATVRARNIELDAAGCASFDLVTDSVSMRCTLTLPGRHNVYNALAAASTALWLGVPPETVAAGLRDADVSPMRMEVIQTAGGVTVLNDAYNANPVSMRAAVATLMAVDGIGRHIAVLGDMAELGSYTELEHFGLGELVARSHVDVLVTVGPRAERIAAGAIAEGMSTESVRPCATPEEAGEVLDDLLEPGDVTLIKASRVMGLERVTEGVVTPR